MKVLLKTEQDYVNFLVEHYDLDDIEHHFGFEFQYGGKYLSEMDYDEIGPYESMKPDKTNYKKRKGFEYPKEYPCVIQVVNDVYWDGTDLGFNTFEGFFYESDFKQ